MLFIGYFIIRLNKRFGKLDETCSFLFRRIVVETTCVKFKMILPFFRLKQGNGFKFIIKIHFKRKFIG